MYTRIMDELIYVHIYTLINHVDNFGFRSRTYTL